jgi:ATP-binding cassette subfamily C protein CydD
LRIERRLSGSVRPAVPNLILTIGLGLVGALITILLALLLSRMVTGIYLGGLSTPAILPTLFCWTALALLRVPVHIARSNRAQAAASEVKGVLRAQLTSTLIRFGPQWVSDQRSGELLNSLTAGIEALDTYIGGYLPQIVLAAVIPLLMLVILAPIDLISALVLLLTTPLIPLFMILIGDMGERLTRRRWRSLGQLSAILLDTLQGLSTLKLLGQARLQRERIATAGEGFRRSTMDVLRVTFLSALILEWVAMLGTAILAVEIGLRLLQGGLGFEAALFILLLAPEFYSPLRMLGARFHAGMSGYEASRRIYDLIEAVPPRQVRAYQVPPAFSHGITFEGVCFSYPERSEEALNGIQFNLQVGENLAVLGPSGCGKTTLTKLLLRFIEPNAGSIHVDGQLLGELDPDLWREQIAWVPQIPHLFSGSALENIRLGRPEASFEQVQQAARAAGLHQDLLTLPDGYDTPLGERGSRLSAGQAQRVALARAFLKDAPLLILDEATARLDPLLEQSLLTNLRRLMAGRTTLIITHRLAAARLAERVMVMNAGRIVQIGTHASLQAVDGPYARIMGSNGSSP